MNGVDWQVLDADDVCDMIYSLIIDDIMEMGAARSEAREVIDKRLKDHEVRAQVRQGIKPEPEPFVLDNAQMARMGIRIPKPARPSTPQNGGAQ